MVNIFLLTRRRLLLGFLVEPFMDAAGAARRSDVLHKLVDAGLEGGLLDLLLVQLSFHLPSHNAYRIDPIGSFATVLLL